MGISKRSSSVTIDDKRVCVVIDDLELLGSITKRTAKNHGKLRPHERKLRSESIARINELNIDLVMRCNIGDNVSDDHIGSILVATDELIEVLATITDVVGFRKNITAKHVDRAKSVTWRTVGAVDLRNEGRSFTNRSVASKYLTRYV